jgi:hypothetical protein
MKTHRKLFPELFHNVTPPDPAPDGEAGGGGAPDPADSSTGGEGLSAKDFDALRTIVDKERERSKRLEAQLKKLDPALVEAARQEAEDARRLKEEAEQAASTRVAAIQQRSQAEVREAREEAAKAKEDARRLMARVKWESEFIAAEGFTEASEIDGVTSFDLLWNQIGHMYEQDEQGLYLKGADGLAVINKETGKRVTPREHYELLRNDSLYSAHFRPIGGSGGGSGAGVRGRVQHKQSLDGMSSRDLLRLGLEGK